jgi:hypothetical protein
MEPLKKRAKCQHGRERSRCKECGGASICQHGRHRSGCKECGGAGICQHGRRRSRPIAAEVVATTAAEAADGKAAANEGAAALAPAMP